MKCEFFIIKNTYFINGFVPCRWYQVYVICRVLFITLYY